MQSVAHLEMRKRSRSVYCSVASYKSSEKSTCLASSVNRLVNFRGPAANFAEDVLCMLALCRLPVVCTRL